MTPSLETLGINHLSVGERLELIATIWDSIPETPEALLMPDWHREELERRLAASDVSPDQGAPWEQVVARLKGRQ